MNKYKSDDYKLSAVHFYLKNNKSIIEYETELSQYNRKTINIENFKIYIREKNLSYLCRESNQALKPSCYKQTLQGYETTQP